MQLFDDSQDDGDVSQNAVVRVGEVTSVDAAKLTARVTFDDEDSCTSFDLPVLQRNTMKNADYALPDIGEDVLCIFLPSGTSEGFVVGSFYAGEVAPPQSSADVREVKFEDGTVLKYDRAAHKLEAEVHGDAAVTLTGKAEVTAQGAVSVASSERIVLTAPQIVLNGAITSFSQSGGAGTMTVNGSMTATGDVTASGVSLKSHTHTAPDGETSTPH